MWDIGRKQEKIAIYEPEAKESSDIVTEHAVWTVLKRAVFDSSDWCLNKLSRDYDFHQGWQNLSHYYWPASI